MPPRASRKASGGSSGAKKTVARIARGAQKAQQNPPEAVKTEEQAKAEDAKAEESSAAEAKADVKAQEDARVEEKQAAPEPAPQAVANGSASSAGELDDTKEAYEEEDKGERLELDDNDPEYEHEEEAGVDYDGRDGEHEAQEEEDGYEVEERDAGEDDADMIEEIEEEEEDVEGEEEEENTEEHEVDGEEEDHDAVQERRKRKEFEVFVGGLDKDATEDDLRKVFSAVGEVTELRLMMNPQTKKNKGFAFLRFATVEQAKRAVSELKNPVVHGKQCGVSPSQDSDTLFVGNINKSWSKEELKEKLKQYGIENVDDLTLVEDTNNEGMNRGFAFLEFSSRSDAMDAYRRLQRRDVSFGTDKTAKVAFADTFVEPDDEIMAQVKTVFVDGLPSSWDEDRVKEYLKKYGVIEKIELARNMPSAKRKDFGFVTFDTHDSAVACAEGINNAELGEGDKKVKVRGRLSRPHQRGRAKRSTRGDFRINRGAVRGGRLSWGSRPAPRRYPAPPARPLGVRSAPAGARGFKRPVNTRDRRPIFAVSERVRRLPAPERSYDRRPPVSSYSKSSSKWDSDRRTDLPPRSRAPIDYPSRAPIDRRSSYRDEFASRGPSYNDMPSRTVSRPAPRRGFADEPYGRRVERPHTSTYRESRARDYDPLPGSKRPYSTLDDAPPRYADVSVRQSRARVDYGLSGSSQYSDSYGERPDRAHIGYGSSRGSLSGQDSHEFYSSSRHGMDYGADPVRSSDAGGVYSSSFGRGGYLSRGSDVGGSSYSSMYSGRSLSGNDYMGGSGSGSYY